jgi:phosphatidate cytidylyltransferase
MAGVYILLAVATTATRVAIRNGIDLGEVAARVRAWWAMVVIFTAGVAMYPIGSVVLFAAVSALGLMEYTRLAGEHEGRLLPALMIGTIPVQYVFVLLETYGFFAIFIPVYVFLALPAALVLAGRIDGFLFRSGVAFWGVMLTVYTVSHAPFLIALSARAGLSPAGMLLFLVVLTELNDVAQFLWGKALGGRRIAPAVSPNKTLEGVFGGIFTTTALAVAIVMALPQLTPFSWWHAALFGAGIAITGILGDLTVSAVKRDLGVKDTGALLPGHGGILDRIDSLTFTAPLVFHAFRYFY